MGAAPLSVLVVDDEPNIRTTLAACLRGDGCDVAEAADVAGALAAVRATAFDVAFVDLRLGVASGLDLVASLRAERPALAVIVITAYATFESAVEALRRGASDYLPKPFTPAQIRHVVERARQGTLLTRRVRELERRLDDALPEVDLATRSAAFARALDVLERAAAADAPVLLRGESGTGKGVMARALHGQSPRRDRPFVTVSCPVLTADLLASELFGHVRGAFTGAAADRPGRIEEAEGGTLFLDEVSEMPPALQAKLLRFVQERRFERVGENRTRVADVRIVAATNRDLEEEVRAGRFREDLMYRLDVVQVTVPPLRERPDDIEPLAERFAAFFARGLGRAAPRIERSALDALRAYAWPGNVRELRNAVERAVILYPVGALTAEHLPERVRGASADRAHVRLGGACTLQELEDEHVRLVVAAAPTLDEAARVLGIDPSTLWRRRRRLERSD